MRLRTVLAGLTLGLTAAGVPTAATSAHQNAATPQSNAHETSTPQPSAHQNAATTWPTHQTSARQNAATAWPTHQAAATWPTHQAATTWPTHHAATRPTHQAAATRPTAQPTATHPTPQNPERQNPATPSANGAPDWRLVHSGTAEFRGLAAVSARVAWAAGTGGVVLRTVDGGRHWGTVSPPGAGGLEFRDIEATDAYHAVALSIGPADASRIYVTGDGGRHWTEAFRNTDPDAFYDCTAFYDRRHGLAMSDPVGGRFRILSTSDGGYHWRVLPAAGMPPAQDGEAGFAASGTCLVTSGHTAFLASGGGAVSRVYRSDDLGRHWRYAGTSVPSSASAGIFSLAFQDPWHGVAVGGDFEHPANAPHGAAVTRDGGRRWVGVAGPGEYRSGAAFAAPGVVLAVGPTGSDLSTDGGRSWRRFDDGSFDAVQCRYGACWASGVDGRIAVLS